MGAKVKSTIDPWFTTLTLTLSEARAALASAFPSSPSDTLLVEGGVLPSASDAGLGITSTGTTSAPKVTVAAGRCVVPATGMYGWECTLPGATQVNLSAPPATNPRKDLVVARVYGGTETSEADTGFYIETVDGTPASSPQPPEIPVRSIPLWDAQVSTGGVVTFTDRRQFTRAAGGIRRSIRNTTRAGSHPTDLRISELGVLETYLGTTWTSLASPAVWTQFTPTLRYGGAGGGTAGIYNLGTTGTAVGRYIQIGKLLHLRYVFRSGGTGINGGSGSIYTTLPAGFTSAPQEETQILAKLNTTNATGIWNGVCFIPANSTDMFLYFPNSQSDCRINSYRVANAPGAAGTGIPFVSGGYPDVDVLVIQGTIELA